MARNSVTQIKLLKKRYELEERLTAHREDVDALQLKMRRTRTQLMKTIEGLDHISAASMDLKNPKWKWLLSTDQGGSQSLAKRKLLDELLPWDKGLVASGYYHATDQVSFKVTLHKEDKDAVSNVFNKIKMVYPYVLPIGIKGEGPAGEQENWRVFELFENTLSENGSYSLRMKNLKTARLMISVHHRESLIVRGTLVKVLEYIYKNHYYGED